MRYFPLLRTPAAIAIAAGVLVSCGEDPDSLTGSGTLRKKSSSGSSSDGELVGSGDSPNELCWSTINEYRKREGLPELARWSDGESCAEGEAKSDAQANRAHGAFPRCGELAQNECPGTPGPAEEGIPKCLALMWAEGPGGGHRENMASTKYKEVACGVFTTARGEIWSVQNFR